MKVVILAGGFGTRLSEYTDRIPKPMVEIHGKPILTHIMDSFSAQGFDEFIIALGYKADYIKNYFIQQLHTNGDLSLDFSSGKSVVKGEAGPKYKVELIDTGINSLTGDRLRNLRPYLDERFIFTYGDGLSNVNIKKLLKFHEKTGSIATITAVRPRARFGALEISETGVITSFKEKPQTEVGRINGGFMVMEPEVFSYLAESNCTLEREPLEQICSKGKLSAFEHNGFWHCIDTKRDLDEANDYDPKMYPWLQY